MGRLLSRATGRTTQAHVRHISPVPRDSADGPVAQVYAQVERDFGILAPPISLHSPAPGPLAAAWLMLRETLLADGPVRRSEREAVAVAISHTNRCPYCVEVHNTALYGLVSSRDAVAIGDDDPGEVKEGALARIAGWARSGGRRVDLRPEAGQAPHLIGTAMTFHYLNRMVNVFLADSPIPQNVSYRSRRMIRRIAGTILQPMFRRSANPGASLDLLPAATLPVDLAWAAGSPSVAGALARAAAAIDDAADRSVPQRVRDVMTSELAGWNGEPLGLGDSRVPRLVATLPEREQPVARLALQVTLASYQVGPKVIEEFRGWRSDDRSLIEVAAWASMAAARWWGARLWSYTDPSARGAAPPDPA